VAQRDFLIRTTQPLLERDEQVANVVKALEGPNRWVGMTLSLLLGFLIGISLGAPIVSLPVFVASFQLLYAKRVILATDESVVLIDAGRLTWKPRRVLARLPVDTRIGPLRGLWLKTSLGDHTLFVQPRWVKEVAAADADLDDETP
jgi:hypothetical protein